MYEGSRKDPLATSIVWDCWVTMDLALICLTGSDIQKHSWYKRKNPAQMTDNMRYDIAKVVCLGFLNTCRYLFNK